MAIPWDSKDSASFNAWRVPGLAHNSSGPRKASSMTDASRGFITECDNRRYFSLASAQVCFCL